MVLNENYELFGTGSQSSLAASMVAAYEKGKPWIGYYWEPTWVMGKLDMTLIEEAPYDEEVWGEYQSLCLSSFSGEHSRPWRYAGEGRRK